MAEAGFRSLAEVRAEIDRLDRELMPLIAARGRAVLSAARFKADIAEVPAPERLEQVVRNVLRLAAEHGAIPSVVEATWRAMIAAFIAAEAEEHRRLHPPAGTPRQE
ncbi:chorismate mutase [Roseomonas sp. CCTCC AB2023176]|uniref:chorismate mutase n=1 Tax=Roseomonas sp. CCTCC AB2023176 TaxID=3342640 RepID=UPI0035E07A6C